MQTQCGCSWQKQCSIACQLDKSCSIQTSLQQMGNDQKWWHEHATLAAICKFAFGPDFPMLAQQSREVVHVCQVGPTTSDELSASKRGT